MRKVLAIVLIALALGGCENPTPIDEHIIGFASNLSRAIIDGVGDLQSDANGLKLYASYTLDGTPHQLLDAEKLFFSNNTWNYTNTRYWVTGLSYSFCVVYPFSTPCSYNNGKITIANYAGSPTGADLLYASYSRDLTNSEDYSPVPLRFNHACAALQFNIINASNVTVYQVSDIYLVGLRNSGTFTFGADVAAEWELGSSVVAANDKITFGGTNLQNLPININLKQPLYSGGAILVLPQDIADTNVTFHVAIKRQGSANSEEKTILLGQIGGSAPVKWEAGKKYEYTMTIKENEIVSNVSVIPWVDHYVDL